MNKRRLSLTIAALLLAAPFAAQSALEELAKPKEGRSMPGAANHGEIVIGIFWGGNPRPAVETPFGNFFALPLGERRPRVEAVGRHRDNDWRKNPVFSTLW